MNYKILKVKSIIIQNSDRFFVEFKEFQNEIFEITSAEYTDFEEYHRISGKWPWTKVKFGITIEELMK